MITIRLMGTLDISFGMRLKSQAQWNQVEADWRRFLEMQPDGCFVAELDGTPAGTTVTCVFGDVAWLAMVLVDERVRGRGVGTALLRHAIAFLDRRGVRTVRLDATALGQPLYERLGFTAEYPLARYAGILGEPVAPAAQSPATTTRAAPEDLPRMVALDREVTGADREQLLARLFADNPTTSWVAARTGKLEGYLMARPGTSAEQIGPCIASPHASTALVVAAAASCAGQRVHLDVPSRHEGAVRLAQTLGLTVERTFVRMRRGPAVVEDTTRFVLSSGPELG
jgi:GNAT superfamily N-acetyltransferase